MQVVHRRERQPPRPGDRLGGAQPDEQGADQAGPGGDGDQLHVGDRRLGAAQRLLDDGDDELEVAAARDLGDDSSEACVQLVLRGDDARPDLPVARDERGRRLVARRLDPENHAGSLASRHMISASSRLSA